MKKLTNYQRTAQYLNKVFKLINEEYFNNELKVPTITIQSTVGAYGHVSVNKVWHNDTIATHELNLSADYLNRPIENIVATLIHEGCHLYALQNNIKDTSNRGIYHNKRFKALQANITVKKPHLMIMTSVKNPLNTTTIQNSTEKKSTNSFLHCTRMI